MTEVPGIDYGPFVVAKRESDGIECLLEPSRLRGDLKASSRKLRVVGIDMDFGFEQPERAILCDISPNARGFYRIIGTLTCKGEGALLNARSDEGVEMPYIPWEITNNEENMQAGEVLTNRLIVLSPVTADSYFSDNNRLPEVFGPLGGIRDLPA